MKRYLLIAATLLLSVFKMYSSTTGPYSLFTKNWKHSIFLAGTVWKSVNDGERIFFDTELMDYVYITGRFENGVTFTVPPKFMTDKASGMTSCVEGSTECDIEFGKSSTNKFTLTYKNKIFYLTDKRGIRYKLIKGEPEKINN